MCAWKPGIWPALLALCAPAWCAEIASPADRDSITQQQKTLLEQAQQQREALQNNVELPGLPLPEPAAAGAVCQPVRQIVFQGAEHLSWSVKESLARPYQGRCLTLEHINRLVRETTNAYLQRGYVTSQAWLQEQDISRGVLTVSASEGRIESITQNGEQALALKMAFPGLVGDVLNLRDIEQGMEQLNRLPSQQVAIDIQPGEQPGFSNVVLLRGARRAPVSFSFGADNSGQKSTGTGQMNAAFTLDNPLRLADQWSLSAARNNDFSPHHRSRSLNGGVTLPYGYWLFSYQYAWNDFFQRVPFNGAAYRYQGNNQTQRLGANRTLLRDGKRKLAVDIGLARRTTENKLAGERLGVSSPTLSVASLGLNYSAAAGGGYMTLNPTVSRGLRMLGATADDPERDGAPRSEFRKLGLSASYFYPLAPSLYYLTSAYGQTSADNLYAGERISIGGQYSVRGFKEQYLTGNRGAYWRNELNWQWQTLPGLGELSFTGALDAGWLQGRAGLIDGGSVAGAALGATLNGRWFNQAITVGKPLTHPGSLQPDRWVAYWQATVTL
ncbi:ShlB/FhaC/HecB family hemolysin secretion/activation protein [Serratia marcescens]|uniref:ShlB/FhaC/HecB family hemolysin secretion/activation protein n=1 Tax=Serratia marcescens TaxID=615 RepID=UPI000A363F0B|nr:ShlB/FhaC/HecB family hemolysin secretion/activation protein [Serratia marcescens]MBH2984559.1 ShlB/FhaC/HecB family hemolysin secretion/activation protein [Serratia marcescens]OUI68423.1 polypeptide-transport-associated domain-containing protein [Serratia marcescens]